jgi:hypothetical protein
MDLTVRQIPETTAVERQLPWIVVVVSGSVVDVVVASVVVVVASVVVVVALMVVVVACVVVVVACVVDVVGAVLDVLVGQTLWAGLPRAAPLLPSHS